MTDKEKILIKLLYNTARELWSAALTSCSVKRDLYEDMTTLSEGDLVFEISSWGARDYPPEKLATMIGYLESFGDSGEYRIRTLIGDELINWSNAKFLRFPEGCNVNMPTT